MRTVVGIDLGTTYSLVAHFGADGPRIIPNALGELLTPSAVSIAEDGHVLVGAPARARATTHVESTFLAFKRDMGSDRVFTVRNRSFRPQELSAFVLKALKDDAETMLGRRIDEAVITVPAYFDDLQRCATRDAAEIAGIHVERIINEPTAAALAYGLHHRDREVRSVVLDLGGGTFDVTVLEIIEGVVEIQGSAGDIRLGGEEFDAALAELAIEGFNPDLRADLQAWARVRNACELVKRRLTMGETAEVVIPDLPARGSLQATLRTTLRRDAAEARWAPLLERIRIPVMRALRDANRKPSEIDEVLLVGGATRMPCFVKLATELFGRLPLRSLPPDEAVALGAAVQAALKNDEAAVEDMVVTDIAPFSLGIASASVLGDRRVTGVFSPIINRGTVIPVSRVERFHTIEHSQTHIMVEVYQGEHSLCANNRRLGVLDVRVPPGRAGEQAIDVRLTYDLNGILDVDATVIATGKTVSVTIEQTPGRLTPAQVSGARKAMQRLKFHPRDALPNTTALARADALYVELTGPARAELGDVIAKFRVVLEEQDQTEIEAVRGRLLAMLDSLSI